MTTPRHSRRASAALQKLAERDPAFAALSLWCAHRDTDLKGPARSTATTISYGPAFTALSLDEQVGLAAHHILHIALRHATRGAGLRTRLGETFETQIFTLGADALINETLLAIGYIQPRPHVTLDTLELPHADVAGWDVERLYFALTEQETVRRKAGRDSVLHRAAEDGLEEDLEIAAQGAEEDGARGPTEMEWRQHLARALEAGRLAGRGLGMLGHRLADIPETSTPWAVLLRRLAARALQTSPHQSYRRPSGRWVAMEAEARRKRRPVPVFEPSQQRLVHQPRIVVGLDSSGSVTGAQLGLFAAQIGAIARRGGAELHLLVFDEDVRSAQQLNDRDLPRVLGTLDLSRDGGTDFRPVLAQATALAPSLIVMLSDLDGPLPEVPPACPLVWALPASPPGTPPFGKVLVLDR
jgi:predicted metal-dependent peptidase